MEKKSIVELFVKLAKKLDKSNLEYKDDIYGFYGLPCKKAHIPNYNKRFFKGYEKKFETCKLYYLMVPDVFCNIMIHKNDITNTYDVTFTKFDPEVFWMIIDTMGEE